MTAVIGILNKTGVALAADSAVTISDGKGRKIYNTAYKIFTLSKFHPISVMIYNSASLMGIPWEVLIKEYRKELGQKEFDTVSDYQKDFIKYLKSRIDLIPIEDQQTQLTVFVSWFFKERLLELILKDNSEELNKLSRKKQFLLIAQKLIEKINEYELHYKNEFNNKKLLEFRNYTLTEFKKINQSIINSSFQKFFGKTDLKSTHKSKLTRIIYYIISSPIFYGSISGLVFTGYGKKQIYPACVSLQVGEVFNNRIRYALDKDKPRRIGENASAMILPFAQRDVIDTILTGIDQDLESTLYSSFASFLSKFTKKIAGMVEPVDKNLSEKIESIDVESLMNDFADDFLSIKEERHIMPLMSSIETLSKEDLADLAESLVYLTYLKRRMSFSEESVGGPIDVAIITKGDGLVWIKRKHYFDLNLNQDFVVKYLNTYK